MPQDGKHAASLSAIVNPGLRSRFSSAAQAEDKAARARLGSQAVKTLYFASHFHDTLPGGAYGSGSLLQGSPPAVKELALGLPFGLATAPHALNKMTRRLVAHSRGFKLGVPGLDCIDGRSAIKC
jgi:hypothetical protein